MTLRFSNLFLFATALLAVPLLGGCAGGPPAPTYDLTPVTGGYDFMKNHPDLSAMANNNQATDSQGLKLSAYITSPAGDQLEFTGNAPFTIKQGDKPYQLVSGVYPFKLSSGPAGTPIGCGAIAVYNLDKTLELASFGLSAETKIFNDDVTSKASAGTLASQIISFDGKPRITYWMGNRVTPAAVDQPSAELDFTGNPGIIKLVVDGNPVPGKVATIDTEKLVAVGKDGPPADSQSVPDTNSAWVTAEHQFVISFGAGRTYHGYIRNLRNCDYTMFMRLPCTIPNDLITAASHGTISKLTIYADGAVVYNPFSAAATQPTTEPVAGKVPVAELVFGITKDEDAN